MPRIFNPTTGQWVEVTSTPVGKKVVEHETRRKRKTTPPPPPPEEQEEEHILERIYEEDTIPVLGGTERFQPSPPPGYAVDDIGYIYGTGTEIQQRPYEDPRITTEQQQRRDFTQGRIQAEEDAGVRVEQLRPTYQQEIAEDYEQRTTMDYQDVGMVQEDGMWTFTDEQQVQLLRERGYVVEPDQQGNISVHHPGYLEQAQQRVNPRFQQEARDIYREEYAEEDIVMVTENGELILQPGEQYRYQQQFESTRGVMRGRITGEEGIGPQVGEGVRFITSTLTTRPGDLLGVAANLITGDMERVLDIFTERSMAMDDLSIPEIFVESYKPGGFGFIGTLAAATVGIGGVASGVLGGMGAGGKIIAGITPFVLAGASGAIVGAELGFTKNLEDMGELPPGSTAELLGRRVTEFGIMYGAGTIAATSPYSLLKPKYLLTRSTAELFTGEKLDVLGVKEYRNVFGKTFYGRHIPVAAKYTPGYQGYGAGLETKTGIVPYSTPLLSGLTDTSPGPGVISFSQISGNQKLVYDVQKGTFAVERITPTGKPFKLKTDFEPPPNKPLTPEEILFRPDTIDLFKKYSPKIIQKKITDFERGNILVDEGIQIPLEDKPDLSGMKDLFKKKTTTPMKSPDESTKIKTTEADEKRWMKQNEEASKALSRMSKTFTMRDLFKAKTIQTKLPGITPKKIVDRPIQFPTEFKPPIKNIKPVERILEDISKRSLEQFIRPPKPVVKKTTQTDLDKILRTGKAIKINEGVIESMTYDLNKAFKSKPLKFEKKITDKSVVEKPSDKGKVVLEKPEKTINVDKIEKSINGSQEKVSTEWLRKLGRFDEDIGTTTRLSGKPPGPTQTDSVENTVLGFITGKLNIGSIKQEQITGQLPDVDVLNIQGLQSEGLLKTQGIEQGIIQQVGTVSIQDLGLAQNQMQEQAQVQLQKQTQMLDLKLKTVLKISDPIESISAKISQQFGIDEKIEKGFLGERQGFDVYVKKRQFVNGKKIRGTEWTKINTHPLNELDAKGLGSNKTDNTAKRTFKLVEVDGKPRSLRRKVVPWDRQMLEYNRKGNDRWVEKNLFAIDTPGELNEITERGIAARTGKSIDIVSVRGMGNIEKKANRMMRRMVI